MEILGKEDEYYYFIHIYSSLLSFEEPKKVLFVQV
jgi:hypothetical protein